MARLPEKSPPDSALRPFGLYWIGLVAAVVVGGLLRLYGLGAISLADDEAYKVNAVNAYRAGHWVVSHDDEHPLGMKILIYASYAVRDYWNAHVADAAQGLATISTEAATRTPNAIVGALIALLIALIGRDLYSRRVGVAAALLWAVEVNSVGFSRLAKEDTLLTFFLLACFHFMLAARRAADAGGTDDLERSRRSELWAAVMLGLAFACKYFFHLAFVLPLFYAWSRWSGSAWRVPLRRWLALIGLAFAVFLSFNPTVLHPANLHYIFGYMGSSTLHAHAYLFMGRVFMNQALEGGHPTPWYFYFVFLAVKTCLPLLAAALVGVAVTARRGGDGARLFTSLAGVWLLVHAVLSGGKFTRYIMPLMPVVCLLAALGADALAAWAHARLPSLFGGRRPDAAALALLAVVLLPAAWISVRNAPHYRMYINALGGPPERVRWWFPHCDFYDVGLREAVEYVCDHAPVEGAQLRADPDAAAILYAAQCRRAPLEVTGLAETYPPCHPGRACYQILQVSRTDFGTRKVFESLHASGAPNAVVRVRGVEVAEIYGPEAPASPPKDPRPAALDTVVEERVPVAAK